MHWGPEGRAQAVHKPTQRVSCVHQVRDGVEGVYVTPPGLCGAHGLGRSLNPLALCPPPEGRHSSENGPRLGKRVGGCVDRVWVGLAQWMLLLHPILTAGWGHMHQGDRGTGMQRAGNLQTRSWSHLLLRAQWKCHQGGALTCLQLGDDGGPAGVPGAPSLLLCPICLE